jgi:hypothetical protein
MVGYVVLKCEEQAGLVFGRIFELIVLPGQGVVARHLLKQAVGFFEAAGADLIIYRLVGNRPYRKYLKESGFMYSGWLSRRARFIARSNTTRIFTPFLSDPANWFMQSGDSDAV